MRQRRILKNRRRIGEAVTIAAGIGAAVLGLVVSPLVGRVADRLPLFIGAVIVAMLPSMRSSSTAAPHADVLAATSGMSPVGASSGLSQAKIGGSLLKGLNVRHRAGRLLCNQAQIVRMLGECANERPSKRAETARCRPGDEPERHNRVLGVRSMTLAAGEHAACTENG